MPGPSLRLIPAIFVLLWSSGWVVARYAVIHSDPLTFLTARFGSAFLVAALFALMMRASWPHRPTGWLHAIFSGSLLHAGYLGTVWWAIKAGLPAGISGLIAGLQPLITAALGGWLIGEYLRPQQWLGIATGLVGVVLVLGPRLAAGSSGTDTGLLLPILLNLVGVLSGTLGSFYQKRFLNTGDLRTITALQFFGAVLVTLPVALALEPELRFDLTPETFYALAWSVLPLSIGAVGLMLVMIRSGSVSRVASLIYLVPPAVAIQTYLLFDERLVPIQIAGMAIATIGVYLTTAKR